MIVRVSVIGGTGTVLRSSAITDRMGGIDGLVTSVGTARAIGTGVTVNAGL